MKTIHKVNRKGKRAVHKKRKKGKWSEHFVQTTTYSKKIASPLAREPRQKCRGFFLIPKTSLRDPPIQAAAAAAVPSV